MGATQSISTKIDAYIAAIAEGYITPAKLNELLHDINNNAVYSDAANFNYAPVNHNHNLLYAEIAHNHDTAYAAIVHTHALTEVTGLQSALDAKSDNHAHPYSLDSHNHDSLYSEIVHTHNYAATSHNHDAAYAAISHTHSIAQVTGLQTALDNKSDVHTHPYLNLAGGTVTGPATFNQTVTFGADVVQVVPGTIQYNNEIYSQNDFITLRNGAVGAVTGLSGFRLLKYNAVDNMLFGVGSDGWARIGDEGDVQQKIATLEETPLAKFMKYNTTSLQLESTDIAIADVISLQTSLDGKASSTHNHIGVYANATHTHSYLPLTGGTVTGKITLNFGDGSNLDVGRIYGGSDNNDYIEIDGGDGDYIKFVVNAVDTLKSTKDALTFKGSNIWHAANFDPTNKSDIHSHPYASDTHNHSGVYANATHTHSIANVTGLQTAIDAKSDIHSHPYASDSHNHSGVYANASHTHSIANVTGLQTAIDAKSDIHSHPYASDSHNHDSNYKARNYQSQVGNVGWYRIAEGNINGAHNTAIFSIRASLSGKHNSLIFAVSNTYGNSPTITLLSHARYATGVITKIRLLEYSTYDQPFVEIYLAAANATISVELIGSYGFTLTSTAGSIPASYSAIELDINTKYGIASTNEMYVNDHKLWHAGNLAKSEFATASHNHSTTYLGLTAKATDSSKLNGQSASFYAVAHSHPYAPTSHTHSYLPLSGGTLTGGIILNQPGTIAGSMVWKNNLTSGGWARGISLASSSSANVAGIGMYGSAQNLNHIYLGWGDVPYSPSSAFIVSSSLIQYKGNDLWHSGNFTPSSKADVHSHPYAATSHTHSYLPLSGGTLTGNLYISKTAGRLIFNESTYASYNSGLEFKTTANQNITLLHEITDGDIPAAGQALILNGSGGTAHFVVQGELFALSDKKVWHAGNFTPSSKADVHSHPYASDSHNHSTTYLGISAKAVDSDKLDGLNYTSFLRSDANDSFTGRLVIGSTNSRQAGIYGVYDSYRTAHVWSMGENYKIPTDGSDFGNLYGLAYKHTNNATGGTMGNGHQIVWVVNGSAKVALGTNIWTSGTIYEASATLASRYLGISAKAADSDKWDGYQFADYLNQAVKSTSTPIFAGVKATKIGIYDTAFDCYMEVADSNPSFNGDTYGGTFSFYGDKALTGSLMYVGGILASRKIQAVGFVENGSALSTKYAASSHNHDTAYLGKTDRASDSAKLNGNSASFYAAAHSHPYASEYHNHDSAYAAASHTHDNLGAVEYYGGWRIASNVTITPLESKYTKYPLKFDTGEFISYSTNKGWDIVQETSGSAIQTITCYALRLTWKANIQYSFSFKGTSGMRYIIYMYTQSGNYITLATTSVAEVAIGSGYATVSGNIVLDNTTVGDAFFFAIQNYSEGNDSITINNFSVSIINL